MNFEKIQMLQMLEKNISQTGGSEREINIKSVKILGSNLLEVELPFIIEINFTMLNHNIRSNIETEIRNKYLYRVYHVFYVKEIDFSPIRNGLLPLLKFNLGEEKQCYPLKCKILYVTKNQEIKCKILIYNNEYITAHTDFLLCIIKPSNTYDTISLGNSISIKLSNNKIIKHNSNAIVKIIWNEFM